MPGIAYSDIKSLQGIGSDDAGIRAAAQQFESLFIGMMLKGMREANAAFAENSPLSSPELTMHQEMLDQQWAIHMAESGGIGLAPIIEAQLRGERAPAATDAPASGPEARPALTARALGFKAPEFADRQAFVARLLPELRQALEGLPLKPEQVLAQSALETGWGQRVIHGPEGESSHNLFGIKSDHRWHGDSVEVRTLEFVDGRPQARAERFRSYPDVAAAVRDYVSFLRADPRYSEVLEAGDTESFASAMQRSGYATDPDYGRKITAVIGSLRPLIGV